MKATNPCNCFGCLDGGTIVAQRHHIVPTTSFRYERNDDNLFEYI